MTLSYIALGANLGKAEETIHSAVTAISALPRCSIVSVSSLFRTAPIGLINQPDFINAVLLLETEFSAHEMLDELFAIEQRFGRQRSIPNAARTLDLDLLMHGDETHATATLTLPHPRMYDRAFVLAPLAEISPGLNIPGHGKVEDLLARCNEQTIRRL